MAGAVSRRTLAKGAAWATPVLIMGSAAPALAASAVPFAVTRSTLYGVAGSGNGTTCGTGTALLVQNGTGGAVSGGTSSSAGTGVTITNNTAAAATASGIFRTFLASVSGLAFTEQSGYTSWSTPTQTAVTSVIAGVTYYQYMSTYAGPVSVPASGSVVVPYYSIGNTCLVGPVIFTAGQATATINGTTYQSPAGGSTTCTSAGGCK
ncbi:hypothetical protein [Rudaeicoccus suwonensis]|uniref:Uncharacterized protein n=1 Tax=Rudaeicoccus suwonensis TaxID=657409 RepID=A0A561E6Y7_9MICO|nr:hypothetical protein [Rudaeicoccus suwonensis]TWE11371.1 hypothetical protein BKA23_0133 [Rudaeicoccus suwonensis]